MGLGKYFKTAFLNPWNLLAFLGGMGFALLSPVPDIAASLIMAAELGYLGMLGSHPKFQKYVDAQEAQSTRKEQSQNAERALRGMLRSLPKPSMRKFEQLKTRCLELRQIALDLRQPGVSEPEALESLQLAGLDRLLWIYLKLLFTENSLRKFFEKTDERSIRGELDHVRERIEDAEKTPPSPQRDRILRALQDNLQTCQERLTNYQKAVHNYELVQLEIERLENKIRSLSELAINRHEPEFISGQVDQVADSMRDTEKTINELQFVTGLDDASDDIPELIRRPSVTTRG